MEQVQNTLSDIYTNRCTVLTADSRRAEQPSKIKISLKDHQLSLLNRCREIEDTSFNKLKVENSDMVTKFGIIGDIVGSGKTLSILSLIADKQVVSTNIPKNFSNGLISIVSDTQTIPPKYKQNVIVVPHNVFKQWITAINDYTTLSFLQVGTTKELKHFNEIKDSDELNDHEIILVSSTRYNSFADNVNGKFSRVIFDEADSIKIPSCRYIESSFLWFVTSTFHVLLNPWGTRFWANESGDFSDSYSYYNGYTKSVRIEGIKNTGFIKQTMVNLKNTIYGNEHFKQLIIKNSDEYVKSSFMLPDFIEHSILCKNPLSVSILNTFASSALMNHINAGDIKGAIDMLNCDKVSETDLIKAVTKEFEDKLNNKKIELQMKSQMSYSTPHAKKESLAKIEEKIVEYETKIQGIKAKLDENDLCSICYDDITNIAVTKCCNTKFCLECITKWLHSNKNCPFCRAEINNDNMCVVTDEECGGKKDDDKLTKIEKLKEIISNEKDKSNFKMLIFSDFNNLYEDAGVICNYLKDNNIKYSKIIGTTATINKVIKNYKNSDKSDPDNIDVLMLNAEYSASGINLENTSDIVIVHSMSPQKTKQIIGRGQRPGRVDQLNVWKLMYENEE